MLCKLSNSIYFMISLFLVATNLISAKESMRVFFERCAARSGLALGDFVGYEVENEGCGLRCDTRQGIALSYGINEGRRCSSVPDFRCQLGRCVGKDNPPSEYIGLYRLNIGIKSARVPDLDLAPGQGSSDVYVVIRAGQNCDPFYLENDHIAHTHIIQDDDTPRWKNFVAKPMPLRLSSYLTFELYDSDKPGIPDRIGKVTESVRNLIKRGPIRLPLITANPSDEIYYVEVEVTGKEYQPNEAPEWPEIDQI